MITDLTKPNYFYLTYQAQDESLHRCGIVAYRREGDRLAFSMTLCSLKETKGWNRNWGLNKTLARLYGCPFYMDKNNIMDLYNFVHSYFNIKYLSGSKKDLRKHRGFYHAFERVDLYQKNHLLFNNVINHAFDLMMHSEQEAV